MPAPLRVEPLHHHRGQHRDERDLVKVEDDGFHDRQRQGVGDTDEVRGPRAELAPGVGPQRRDGQREQHPLGHQQGGRAVVDPVQRGEQRQDRRPVVGQQQEVRAHPVGHAASDRDRGVEMRVTADALVEDDQVERAGQEAAEQDEGVQAVDQGGRRGERAHLDAGAIPEPPEPPGTAGRPVSRAGGGRCASRPGTGGLTAHRWKGSSAPGNAAGTALCEPNARQHGSVGLLSCYEPGGKPRPCQCRATRGRAAAEETAR